MNRNNFKREHESFSLVINASAEKIFPLLCPVEEQKWFWDESDYSMIYSDSGYNENNCIFLENTSGPFLMKSNMAEPTYWVTTLYDKGNYVIHWVHVRSSSITKQEVSLKVIGPLETEVTWDKTMTAIKEEANSSFDVAMKDRMKLMLTFVGQSLKHYCETGTMLVSNKTGERGKDS